MDDEVAGMGPSNVSDTYSIPQQKLDILTEGAQRVGGVSMATVLLGCLGLHRQTLPLNSRLAGIWMRSGIPVLSVSSLGAWA
jgi:hypothetical protein